MPTAPQSRAYSAKSGLTSEVCHTAYAPASCSLLILPSTPLSSSTCLTGIPYLTAVVSSARYWPNPPSPVTATTGRDGSAAQAPIAAG